MKSVVVIGAGNMGGALIEGWLEKRSVICVDRNLRKETQAPNFKQFLSMGACFDSKLPSDIEAVVLAVKPQHILGVLDEVAASLPRHIPIISVAAGIPMGALTAVSPAHLLCRAMPNTAARFGQSLTGIYAGNLTDAQFEVVKSLFEVVGPVEVLRAENDMHAFIACVGSAPAFWLEVFSAFEMSASELSGLDKLQVRRWLEASMKAALKTLASGVEPADEQKRIASKGGTTEAGLRALGDSTLTASIRDGLVACQNRSIEMERQNSVN